MQLNALIQDHETLKHELNTLRNAVSEVETTSCTNIDSDWTEEALMKIEAYRDLSLKWSNLEIDFNKLQCDFEELEENTNTRISDAASEVRCRVLMLCLICDTSC